MRRSETPSDLPLCAQEKVGALKLYLLLHSLVTSLTGPQPHLSGAAWPQGALCCSCRMAQGTTELCCLTAVPLLHMSCGCKPVKLSTA